jgi:hypothetical protein
MGYTDARLSTTRSLTAQVHQPDPNARRAIAARQPGIGSPSRFSECLSRDTRPVSQRAAVHSISTPAHRTRPASLVHPAGQRRGLSRLRMGLLLLSASRARAARRALDRSCAASNARSAAQAEKPYESVGRFCLNLNNSLAPCAIVLIAQGSTPPILCNGHSVKCAAAACGCRGRGAALPAGDLVPQLVAWHGTGAGTQHGARTRNALTQRAIQHGARAHGRAIACGRSGPPPPWGLGCPIPKAGRKT